MIARQPKSYEAMVEQTTGHHYDELGNRDGHYNRLITVRADGRDYTDDWDQMSEADRDAHDEWVEELHGALVAITWAEPDVRERVSQLLRDKEWQPETLQACLDDAKSEIGVAS